MTKIKVCGISEEAHALAAAEAGADFIGLVFAPGPRQLTPARAEKIAAAVKRENNAVGVVGVFVNMPAEAVKKIAAICHLDWVQLSGDETWQYCAGLESPVIKALRIGKQHSAEDIRDELARGSQALSTRQHLFLLDCRIKGKYGGTGQAFDWGLARLAAGQFPVVIAGGLNPENVSQAIGLAAPWGLDVSSGVETAGVKDIAKIRAFIAAVRDTDERT